MAEQASWRVTGIADAPAPGAIAPGPVSRESRRNVDLAGRLVREDGAICEFRLVDLSYSGCKVVCEAPLRRGEKLRLFIMSRGLIEAEVRWRSADRAGLSFPDVAAPSPPHWPRRAERVPLTATVKVRRTSRIRYDLRVFDFSTHGCQLEFVDLPKLEEHVWIKLDGLELLEAEVCWLDGFRGGVRFLKTLHPAVLSLFLSKQDLARS